jgi:hypothetical protein
VSTCEEELRVMENGARDTTLAQATRATLFDFSVEEE